MTEKAMTEKAVTEKAVTEKLIAEKLVTEEIIETREELARHIDVSCVQAFHTRDEIDWMIEAAKKYRFACVFTLPAFSSYVAERLFREPDISAGGVVSFPGGGDTILQKGMQARELREMGCGEIDMVMNLTAFKSGEYAYVSEDIMAVIDNAAGIPVKVIIETPYLTEEEIRRAVDLCAEAGAAYVKTSTGWHQEKTQLEHIRIMSSQARGRIRLKAAGGIRTVETIRGMAQAGCSRFGLGLKPAIQVMKDMY